MAASNKQMLVLTADSQVNYLVERILGSLGYAVTISQDANTARAELEKLTPAMIILSEKLGDVSGLDFAVDCLRRLPDVPVLLITTRETPELLRAALTAGLADVVSLPLRTEDFIRVIQRCVQRSEERREWVVRDARRNTASLQRRVDEMETLARLARSINSSLNLNSVLSAIVDAAVEMTNAEEGSLLLLDEKTGELYMRAARNFQEEFVRTFRLPMHDSLAGSVLTSGKPVLLDKNTPQKIKTAYLVQSLIYVPLEINGHVFGVLGVDNRRERPPFDQRDVKLLSALAEVAVIAIQNARLYERLTEKTDQLNSMLNHIQDGVIVLDQDQRLLLVNQVALAAFQLTERGLTGKYFRDIFLQPEMQELLETASENLTTRLEITLADGRIFSTFVNPIPSLGMAITMHDITHLKKLDRIKSDFVSTVSHDLRSPLTAILGYAELLEKVGPLTDMQLEFARRVRASVQSITALVDDLLDLGKIEAGFDMRKESVFIDQLITYSADNQQSKVFSKSLDLVMDLQGPFPPIFANPVQMRQLVDNLLDNAIKYTPKGGKVTITGRVENKQIILRFSDTGVGIPAVDLPFIFDKFFRASNAEGEATGTGLGLAIVKSIVETHQGRIWVDSTVGEGTTFTVVLPLAQE